MEIPDSIECIDCGQPARRLTPQPEEGWTPGDLIAYRCTGCNDRWDMVVASAEQTDAASARASEYRAAIAERHETIPPPTPRSESIE